MRSSFALAWLTLCSSPALAASRLMVEVDRPCVVVVNMRPYPTQGSTVQVDFPDGKEGEQNVRIRNLLGEQIWAGVVDVPREKKVVAKWQLRHMNIEAPQPLQERASADDTRRPKLEDRGIYVVDGELVHLRPGLDPVQVREMARQGKLNDEAKKPPVSTDDPFLTAVQEASTTADAGGGGTPEPGPSSAPAPGGVGKVQLHNRTGSWANVTIDGQLHEFRGEIDEVVELGTGAHRVEIRDFRDKDVWWTGELWVYPDFTVELHFDQATEPKALNREEAWRP